MYVNPMAYVGTNDIGGWSSSHRRIWVRKIQSWSSYRTEKIGLRGTGGNQYPQSETISDGTAIEQTLYPSQPPISSLDEPSVGGLFFKI